MSPDPILGETMHRDGRVLHARCEAGGQLLVGRGGEAGELLDMLKAARAGRPGIALIEGGAGTGRTALLDQLVRRGQMQSMTVLRAQCSAMDQAFTFGMVRQLFGTTSTAWHIDRSSSTDWLFVMFDGLLQQAIQTAEGAPVLIAVDDFHHADHQSAQWIDFLARRLIDVPILVALTADRDVPSGLQELTSEVAMRPLCRPIELGPLVEAYVRELAATVLGQPDDAFAQECFELSGGNPKLLTLLLREFARCGVRPVGTETTRAVDVAPRVLAATLPQWLQRYPDACATVAGMAALLGDEPDAAVVRQLTGVSQHAVTASLTTLERIGVLGAPHPHRFAHPLVRAALFGDLSAAERSDTHARAAHLLSARRAPHERVAAHIMASESPGERWWSETLQAAAAEASARGSVHQAVTYLRRAVDLGGSPPGRAALLIDLGTLELTVDVAASVRHLSEGAELSHDPAVRARCLSLLAEGLVQCGQAPQAVQLLDRLAADTSPQDTEARHHLRGLRIVAVVASGPETIAPTAPQSAPARPAGLSHQALPGATPGERTLLAAQALRASMDVRSAQESADLALRALQNFDTEYEQIWAATLAIGVLFHADQLELAGHWADTVSASDLTGQPLPIRAVLHAVIAQVRFHCADLTGALAAGDEALRLGSGPHPYGAFLAAAAMNPLIESGQLTAARQVADDRCFRNSPENWLRPYFLSARARLRAAEGQIQAALQDLEHCGRLLSHYGGDNPGRIAWRSQAALLHQKRRRSSQAQRLADEELVLARRWGAPIALARSLRVAALVGSRTEPLSLLQESVTLLEGAGDRIELVHSLIAQGTALHAAGQTEAARQTLRRALGLAQADSARWAAEDAYRKLVATGARPRRFSQAGPGSLTVSQRRVVELARQGLSNAEIAQRLYVTQRTVEFHLTHAYRKLGISSRDDLARTLGSAMTA